MCCYRLFSRKTFDVFRESNKNYTYFYFVLFLWILGRRRHVVDTRYAYCELQSSSTKMCIIENRLTTGER